MEFVKRRVGYWMTEKKLRKLGFTGYCERLLREHGIEMVLLDLDQPLNEQGPFDLILHKLTDIMAAASAGDEWSRVAQQRVEAFLTAQPNIRVLDPLTSVRTLTDRNVCYTLMRQCSCEYSSVEVSSPNFVTIAEDTVDKSAVLRQGDVCFPVVCKPLVAHGSDLAHKMSIIFNEDGLRDMQTPCVAQHFVNHNAILFKVFVIGNTYHIVERPSIKNLEAGEHKTIFFDSHDVSKATSASYLTQRDGKLSPLHPNEDAITMLVRRLRQKLSLALFGVDIIIEKDTFRHMFIDINYFPGYDGMPGMCDAFTSLLKSELSSLEPPRKVGASEVALASDADCANGFVTKITAERCRRESPASGLPPSLPCITTAVQKHEMSSRKLVNGEASDNTIVKPLLKNSKCLDNGQPVGVPSQNGDLETVQNHVGTVEVTS